LGFEEFGFGDFSYSLYNQFMGLHKLGCFIQKERVVCPMRALVVVTRKEGSSSNFAVHPFWLDQHVLNFNNACIV